MKLKLVYWKGRIPVKIVIDGYHATMYIHAAINNSNGIIYINYKMSLLSRLKEIIHEFGHYIVYLLIGDKPTPQEKLISKIWDIIDAPKDYFKKGIGFDYFYDKERFEKRARKILRDLKWLKKQKSD